MRAAFIIMFTLLIQMGLLGRVAAYGGCCPVTPLEHCHASEDAHGHDHDHDTDPVEPAHDPCTGGHDSSGEESCPPDCGDHHHHHGSCIHSVQLSLLGDGQYVLDPPCVLILGCERRHLRAPDGPVMELDKPPLI